MKTMHALGLALSAALLFAAAPDASPTPIPPPYPRDAVTHASVIVAGHRVDYTARAGTIELHDPASNAVTGRMFYVAYTKDGANPNTRPVTFFYNGGPGSSTVWLHMGSFAPVRIHVTNGAPTGPAPFHLEPNGYSLIDQTDEVFIDAPNTGYSRVYGAGTPKDFMGVDQDGHAFAQFVERYITAFGRWNSPKVLFGESYGTTRDCVLANDLQQDGVELSGVVLQSSIINFGLGGNPIAGGDWGFVLYFPTEAATAWYHHKAGAGQSLPAFVQSAERFASTTYLHDLALGSQLSTAEFDADVASIHRYLGLPESYVRDSNLRIPYFRYLKELLRPDNTLIGRYDARYQTYSVDQLANTPDWDPSDVGISGAFVGAFGQYIDATLHYDAKIPYRPVSYGGLLGARWDFKHNGDDPPTNVAPDLADAMTQNPHLQVFSANGYYDFATPFFATEYTLEHLGLAPPLQRNITFGFYRSGHMIYLNPAALVQYRNDLVRWYGRITSGR
jgi:carboxypeptidase C (cathepsin A)